jgi:hypothetical protein
VKGTIHNTVTRLLSTGSVTDTKESQERLVLTQEKLDDTGTRIDENSKVVNSLGFQ